MKAWTLWRRVGQGNEQIILRSEPFDPQAWPSSLSRAVGSTVIAVSRRSCACCGPSVRRQVSEYPELGPDHVDDEEPEDSPESEEEEEVFPLDVLSPLVANAVAFST